MPSIRRSIVAYFLVLLGLALLAIGLLTDRFAGDAVRGREAAEGKRITQEFDYRRQEAAAKLDERLLTQAQAVAGEFRRHYMLLARRDFDDMHKFKSFIAVMPIGDIGIGPASLTSLLAVHHPAVRMPLFGMIASASRMEEICQALDSRGEPDFFQVHIPRWKQVARARRQGVELPADIERYGLNDTNEHHFDTVSLAGVGSVRRVIFRTNLLVGQSRTFQPSQPRVGRPPERERPDRDRPIERPNDRPGFSGFFFGRLESMLPILPLDVMFPPIYVQSAYRVSELDERIAELATTQDEQLAAVRTETEDSLARLRGRVLLISILTFLSLAVGGWLIVGIGLAPVRKLSDAAGRVSEKDFRLPVDPSELSTELLPIHARLTQSFDALRRAFEREKQAVEDISHELRTPVSALLATLDVSLRKPRTAEQYKSTLEDCRGITKQLGGLVERVMTLAYMDAGQSTVATREADVAEVAEGCAHVIRPLAESHGLTLTTELDQSAELRTDPDKLREVVMNLLHNAVEYNRPGGNVDLRVRPEANGGALLEVTDTGIGMTADVKDRIFERFFRADASRTATGAHAGLGLAIVKEYLNRMGATIDVQSEPGNGSTFRIHLPATV